MTWEVILFISAFWWTPEGITKEENKQIYAFETENACTKFVEKHKKEAKDIRDNEPFNFEKPRTYVEGICLPSSSDMNKKPGQLI